MAENNGRKKISPSVMLLKGAYINNPVLVQVIGICPIVAAAVSVSTAAVMSIITTAILIICEVLASLALKKVPPFIRVAIYMLAGLVITCPIIYFMYENNMRVAADIGIYLPLLCANSLTALRCEKFAVKNNTADSLLDAVGAAIGYSAVFMMTGAIREVLGNGTLANLHIMNKPNLDGFTMAFGGFVIIGFLSAILRRSVIRLFPHYAKELEFKIKTSTVSLKAETDAVTDTSEKTVAADKNETEKQESDETESASEQEKEIEVKDEPAEPEETESPENSDEAEAGEIIASEESAENAEEQNESEAEEDLISEETAEDTDIETEEADELKAGDILSEPEIVYEPEGDTTDAVEPLDYEPFSDEPEQAEIVEEIPEIVVHETDTIINSPDDAGIFEIADDTADAKEDSSQNVTKIEEIEEDGGDIFVFPESSDSSVISLSDDEETKVLDDELIDQEMQKLKEKYHIRGEGDENK